MSPHWRTLSDSEREREYSPSSCLPDGDYRPFVEAYRRRSDEGHQLLKASTEVHTVVIRYGEAESQTVDIAVPTTPTTPAPVLVVHPWRVLAGTVESRLVLRRHRLRGPGLGVRRRRLHTGP